MNNIHCLWYPLNIGILRLRKQSLPPISPREELLCKVVDPLFFQTGLVVFKQCYEFINCIAISNTKRSSLVKLCVEHSVIFKFELDLLKPGLDIKRFRFHIREDGLGVAKMFRNTKSCLSNVFILVLSRINAGLRGLVLYFWFEV